MPTTDLISASEVARRINVSPRTVQHWITTGRVQPDRTLDGRRPTYLFEASRLDALHTMADGTPAAVTS